MDVINGIFYFCAASGFGNGGKGTCGLKNNILFFLTPSITTNFCGGFSHPQ